MRYSMLLALACMILGCPAAVNQSAKRTGAEGKRSSEAASPAPGNPETAEVPEFPHVTDDELNEALRLYRALRLPEPPQTAELVLAGEESLYLAFRTADGLMLGTSLVPNRRWEYIRPLDPHNLEQYAWQRLRFQFSTPIPVGQGLAIGLHCWARGWAELGRDLVSRSLSESGTEIDQFMQPRGGTPAELLPYLAWNHHGARLLETDVPYEDIAAELAALLAKYEVLDTPLRRELVRGLRVGAPSEAADSLQSRIRAACAVPGQHFNPGYRVGYPVAMQALIREGFDIVPAAISMLADPGATRCYYTHTNSANWPPARFLTVGEYAAVLLDAVSGHRLLDWNARSLVVTPENAEKWWSETSKAGEKAYLGGALSSSVGQVYHEGTALALAQKYPELLAEFYRNWVTPPFGPDEFLSELISASQLPVATKRELFLSTLQSEDTPTRLTALCQLYAADKALGLQMMREELRAVPRTGREKPDAWHGARLVDGPGQLRMLKSAGVDDSETWELLVAAVRGLSARTRARTLLWTHSAEAAPDHVIRFAAAFLDDEEVLYGHTDWDPSGVLAHCEWPEQPVWLQATRHLNVLLGLHARLDGRSSPEDKEAVRKLVREKLKERGLTAFG